MPTTEIPRRREILFRVSHRFYYPTNAGSGQLLGLDGPAFILLSLEYGASDRASVKLGRSNLNDEIELSFAIAAAREDRDPALPFSATLVAGLALTTARPAATGLFESENLHFNAQLALSRRVTDRVSLLCVPSFASNTGAPMTPREHTLGLGFGAHARILDDVALVGEWIPVLAGYETENITWGVGLEARKGGHVFHAFLNNAYGLTTNRYLPGGDLPNGGNGRLGFNIYRSF